jgi:hypothetical protein
MKAEVIGAFLGILIPLVWYWGFHCGSTATFTNNKRQPLEDDITSQV